MENKPKFDLINFLKEYGLKILVWGIVASIAFQFIIGFTVYNSVPDKIKDFAAHEIQAQTRQVKSLSNAVTTQEGKNIGIEAMTIITDTHILLLNGHMEGVRKDIYLSADDFKKAKK